MKIALRLDGKLVHKARKIACGRKTTLDDLIRECLEKLVTESAASGHKRSEIEALERGFRQYSRKLDYGKRNWKREDLYVRLQRDNN